MIKRKILSCFPVFFILFNLRIYGAQVVTNGSFELSPSDSTRPPYWHIGFDKPEELLDSGKWSLDTILKTSGKNSLCLEPSSTNGYFLSQILNGPGYDLKGKLIYSQFSIPANTSGIKTSWNGQDDYGQISSPGIYFIRLSNYSKTVNQKIISFYQKSWHNVLQGTRKGEYSSF